MNGAFTMEKERKDSASKQAGEISMVKGSIGRGRSG